MMDVSNGGLSLVRYIFLRNCSNEVVSKALSYLNSKTTYIYTIERYTHIDASFSWSILYYTYLFKMAIYF